jgi:hypothetical protein
MSIIVAVAGLLAGLLLWLPQGRVETVGGDCLDFAYCYHIGHPHAMTAVLVALGSVVLAAILYARSSASNEADSN